MPGGWIPCRRWITTDCGSVNRRIPYLPLRRPMPEAFIPPCSTSALPQVATIPSLISTVPAWMRSATAMPARVLRVHSTACSPYSVSLAIWTASSTESNG